MNNGWIKLYRGLLEWEWYDDINTTRLFVHCLLRSNHADKLWRGKIIKRGSFFTSLDSLSSETGLTARQIRTSLDKLSSTGEVTSSSQARGRMITLNNYDLYQSDDRLSGNEMSGKCQADDRVATTNKNNKNNKNEINNIFSDSGMNDEQISEVIRIRKKNKGGVISERVARSLIKEFSEAMKKGWSIDDSITEWDFRGWKSFKSEWLACNTQNNNNGQSNIESIFVNAHKKIIVDDAKSRKESVRSALRDIHSTDW